MKPLILFALALPLAAQTVICLPHDARLTKWLSGADVERVVDGKAVSTFERVATAHGVMFGEPAVEPEGVPNRRACYSYAFQENDETTGAQRDSDLTWLFKRLQVAAVSQGVCLKTDTPAACRVKVRAMGSVGKALPKDWRTPPAPGAK
jgi:hypothetical protein